MRARQRLISALLLVLLVPAFVLAATPLKLCLGFDGHRALELVLQGSHHSVGAWVDATDSSSQEAAAHPDCIDVGVLPPSQTTKRSAGADSRPPIFASLPACLEPRPINVAVLIDEGAGAGPYPEYASPSNPQLPAILVTVLRI
jgi:hypothetical protein